MNRLPKQIPFQRLAIKRIKSISDAVRWTGGFVREFDLWYSKFYDWTLNITAKSLKLSGGFYPRFLTQSDEPVAGTGATELDTSELAVWKDTDDSRVYLCFNDGGTIKKVELL